MILRIVVAMLAGVFLVAPVLGQSDVYFSPTLSPELTAPRHFDGPYAGVDFGLMNSNKNVFYPNTNTYRVPAGAFIGYNRQIEPWLIVGAEAQAEATLDWTTGMAGYNAFALGRVGVLTSEDFAVYEMTGLGLVDGRSAYALGVGVEQKVTDTFSWRADALSFGQLIAPGGVTHYGGIMGMKITAGAQWYMRGDATRTPEPVPFSHTPTDFIGSYVGLYAGGVVNPSYDIFVPTAFYGSHMSRFGQGAMAGWNADLGANLRAGGEVQGGLDYNTSGQIGWDAQALARIGIVPVDGVMIYAEGGVGVLGNLPTYSVGTGAEYALWGQNTVRADVQLIGAFNNSNVLYGPPLAGNMTAIKMTVGTLWHFE